MAHPDLDRLLDFLIPFAQKMLKKNDGFYPFAATAHADGTIMPTAIDDGDEKPAPTEMIAGFTELFRHFAHRGGLEAIGICYDGRVTIGEQPKKDAITVFLEHRNGESILIYLPYKKRILGGYKYDSIIGEATEPRVFV